MLKYLCITLSIGGIDLSVNKELFGVTKDGQEVYLYRVDNKKGLSAEFISLGCIIKKLCINGTDVVLGRDTLAEYENNEGSFGAAIGRFANRIGKAQFTLNDKVYKLAANSNGNTLHGGKTGFSKRVWEGLCPDENGSSVEFTYLSADGEEGFPGNLDCKVTYTLTDENALEIHYEAVSDKDTVINFTNHSYFNLNGHNSGSALKHILKINSSFYTPADETGSPTGEILSVVDTPLDFRDFKEVGRDINADFEPLTSAKGYDHNYVLDGCGMREAAVLVGDKTGIKMTTYTDKPGVQLYTGNFIEEGRKCKDGAVYSPYDAVCLETQFFPNSTSFGFFPSPVLRCGDKYDYTTVYKFEINE